jgi:predicted PurR-regulated permease PerM
MGAQAYAVFMARRSNRRQFQVALTWGAAALLVWVLWDARLALLLAFGAFLTAILLGSLGRILARWTRCSEKIGLGLATLLVIVVFVGTACLFGSQLASQLSGVMKQVEAGQRSLQNMLAQHGGSDLGTTMAEKGSSLITSFVTDFASLGLHFLEALIVLVITAIYLAAQPKLYSGGIIAMFSTESRPRVREVIDLVETALRRWLLGQLVLMLIVGALTAVGLLIIGLPDPAALALISGIAEIVPYVGPFVSAFPALLVALTLGWWPILWTAGLYLLVHLIEGYIAAPLLERHFITIPPALILIGIVAVDLVFGAPGIVLAAPITVVVYILIKASYVEDPLELETKSGPA